jgi:hypothetical protein
MKRTSFIIALLALIVSSCEKEITKHEQNNNTTKNLDVEWLNYYDNVLVSSIDTANHVEATFADYAQHLTYSFSTEAKYLSWAKDQNFFSEGKKLELVAIHQNLNSLGEYAISTKADEYYDQTGLIREDILALMISIGIKNEPTEGGIRQLWDYPNYQEMIHISSFTPIPSLGNKRNKAESLKQIGVGCFNKTWFRGSRFYAFTLGGVFEMPDLKIVNFSNKFESISPF